MIVGSVENCTKTMGVPHLKTEVYHKFRKKLDTPYALKNLHNIVFWLVLVSSIIRPSVHPCAWFIHPSIIFPTLTIRIFSRDWQFRMIQYDVSDLWEPISPSLAAHLHFCCCVFCTESSKLKETNHLFAAMRHTLDPFWQRLDIHHELVSVVNRMLLQDSTLLYCLKQCGGVASCYILQCHDSLRFFILMLGCHLWEPIWGGISSK